MLLNMTDLQRACAVSLSLAVLLNVLISVPLAIVLGATGVAMATVIVMSLWNIAMTVYALKCRRARTWFSPFRLPTYAA